MTNKKNYKRFWEMVEKRYEVASKIDEVHDEIDFAMRNMTDEEKMFYFSYIGMYWDAIIDRECNILENRLRSKYKKNKWVDDFKNIFGDKIKGEF